MPPIAENLKQYIDLRDQQLEHKIKYWVVVSVLVQLTTLLPIVFYLGGIYQTGTDALELLTHQRQELDRRGAWMQEREVWEVNVEDWAVTKGFKVPRYRRQVKEN